MEQNLTLEEAKELARHPAWAKLKDRLAQHSKAKEKVKAEAIRQGRQFEMYLAQGFVDGLEHAVKELETLITRLKEESET